MPLRYDDGMVAFEGHCTADEALDLAERLRGPEAPAVDLAACTHMHGALLQTLLALDPVIAAPPQDPFLRACLPEGQWS